MVRDTGSLVESRGEEGQWTTVDQMNVGIMGSDGKMRFQPRRLTSHSTRISLGMRDGECRERVIQPLRNLYAKFYLKNSLSEKGQKWCSCP